jgi:hypothetical protein
MASLAPQQLPRHEVESSDSRKLLPAAHEVASPRRARPRTCSMRPPAARPARLARG